MKLNGKGSIDVVVNTDRPQDLRLGIVLVPSPGGVQVWVRDEGLTNFRSISALLDAERFSELAGKIRQAVKVVEPDRGTQGFWVTQIRIDLPLADGPLKVAAVPDAWLEPFAIAPLAETLVDWVDALGKDPLSAAEPWSRVQRKVRFRSFLKVAGCVGLLGAAAAIGRLLRE